MQDKEEIIKARKHLRKIYIKYTEELHNIITKIDKTLEKLHESKI